MKKVLTSRYGYQQMFNNSVLVKLFKKHVWKNALKIFIIPSKYCFMAPNALYLNKVFPLTNCELSKSMNHSLFFFAQSKLVVSYQKMLNELE